MRVAVIGATGNVGTSVVEALGADPQIASIVGIARRRPVISMPKTRWVAADITTDDLVPHLRGADVVVHLAWLIQPSHDLATIRRTNVDGTARVLDASAAAGVEALVYASSVGAYSPGPKNDPVDERWSTDGIHTSFYSRHKAETERMLDRFEAGYPEIRVVRLRPGLIFKRESATGIRRLFAGPFLPNLLLPGGSLPVVPDTARFVFQTVHAYDVAEAYRLAVVSDVAGAFNIAADPILDPPTLAQHFGARMVKVPESALRIGADVTWRLHLQPTFPGWVDLALESPTLDTSRARDVLGWKASYSSLDALSDLLGGIRDGVDFDTPPLARGTGGPLRLRELATGIGRRSGAVR